MGRYTTIVYDLEGYKKEYKNCAVHCYETTIDIVNLVTDEFEDNLFVNEIQKIEILIARKEEP